MMSDYGMPFYCNLCAYGIESYVDWMIHLTTEAHQTNLESTIGQVEADLYESGVREKVIIVHGIPLEIPLLDVAKFFSTWGGLRDIIYRGQDSEGFSSSRDSYVNAMGMQTMRCIIVFNDEIQAEAVLRSDNVILYGHALQVEPVLPVFEPYWSANVNNEVDNNPGGMLQDEYGYVSNHDNVEPQYVSGAFSTRGSVDGDRRFYDPAPAYPENEINYDTNHRCTDSPYNSSEYMDQNYCGAQYESPRKIARFPKPRGKRRRNDDRETHTSSPVIRIQLEESKKIKFVSSKATPATLPLSVINTEVVKPEKVVETKVILPSVNLYPKIAAQLRDDLKGLKLDEQVDSFCKLYCLSSVQIGKRISIGHQLIAILQKRFSDSTTYPFGNDYLGSACDIDAMNISIDPFGKLTDEFFPENGVIPSCQPTLLTEIFQLLKDEQYKLRFCRDVEINRKSWIYSADGSVKTISLVHRDSGIPCNLVLENFIVVQQSRLLKFLTTLDHRVHPLICYVRFFASIHGLLQNSDEPFGNHSMIWLLVFFLSSKKIIPSVIELQNLSLSPLVVENINISFCSNKDIVNVTPAPMMDDPGIRAFSVLSILKEFFEYFGGANLKQNVVCTAIGKLVPITAFGKTIGSKFPEEIRTRYLFNEDGTPRAKKFYVGSPMGVQDPFDLTVNLAKEVTQEEVCLFQNVCSRAACKLKNLMEGEPGCLLDIFTNLMDEIVPVKDPNDVPTKNVPSSDDESDDEDEKKKPETIEPSEPKEDSSWELDTEDENEDDLSYQDIRKSRVRMNQTLRRYFENAVSRILPQLLNDLDRDSEDEVDEGQFLNPQGALKNLDAGTVHTVEGIDQRKVVIGEGQHVTGELKANPNLLDNEGLIEGVEDSSNVEIFDVLDNILIEVCKNTLEDDLNLTDMVSGKSGKVVISDSQHATGELKANPSLLDNESLNGNIEVFDVLESILTEVCKNTLEGDLDFTEMDIVSMKSDIESSLLDPNASVVMDESPSLKGTEEILDQVDENANKTDALSDTNRMPDTQNQSTEKVLVDDEFRKVVEDEDGIIFVIKKKNLSQMPVKLDSSSESGTDNEEEEDRKRHTLYIQTRRKFQALWMQYLLEFNSIFWSECFGFVIEASPDQQLAPAEFAKVNIENGQLTLKQRLDSVPSNLEGCQLNFRCETPEEISNILYKKKVWKRKFMSAHLKSLWTILSGRADGDEPLEYDEDLESVRLKSFVPFERRMEFGCQLDVAFDLRDEVPKNGVLGTAAFLKLTDMSYGKGKVLRAKKLRFLATVYEKLAMKFLNVRIKKWLASCSDFNFASYDAAFKKDRKKRKGHPKWRKFRRKWRLLGMC